MTSQLKFIVFRRYGLQQSCMNDASGQILEEVTYWRDMKESFGREVGQNLNKNLFYAGATISVCL